MTIQHQYYLESPLTWSEILERLGADKLYLRSTAYIAVTKKEDAVVFSLYQKYDEDFSSTFQIQLSSAGDHRYPLTLGSEVEGCALLLLPLMALWFLGLTGVTLYHLTQEGKVAWQNMQYRWYTFSPFVGIWLLMLFASPEGAEYHTIRKSIEPMLKGKVVKQKRQRVRRHL